MSSEAFSWRLAVAMTFWLAAAPLIFGITWAASLLILSRHLARFAGEF